MYLNSRSRLTKSFCALSLQQFRLHSTAAACHQPQHPHLNDKGYPSSCFTFIVVFTTSREITHGNQVSNVTLVYNLYVIIQIEIRTLRVPKMYIKYLLHNARFPYKIYFINR